MRKITAYIILILLLAYTIIRSDFDLSVIRDADIMQILSLSAVMLISYTGTYLSVLVQFRMLDVKETKVNVLLLSLSTNLLNYLPAKGGVLSLGTFLKLKKKVSINKFVFTTMLTYGIVTVITVILSFFFLFDEKMKLFYERVNFPAIIILILLFLTVSVITFFFAKMNSDNFFMKYYLMFMSNRHMILRNKLNMLYMSLAVISGIVLYSIRMYISFLITGHDISFYHSFMIGVIANLSFFLSFTPGGLGVKEGFVGGVSYLLFGNAAIGIVASLIDRVVNLILAMITGLISIRILEKRFFTKNQEVK
ncbi:MAG: flippase-like domain-containing protein [Candidatus Delongbacteria bacterium]|nr:flippase-like domain-containing protein [Candidatus Delongbacteria bacterium]